MSIDAWEIYTVLLLFLYRYIPTTGIIYLGDAPPSPPRVAYTGGIKCCISHYTISGKLPILPSHQVIGWFIYSLGHPLMLSNPRSWRHLLATGPVSVTFTHCTAV